MVRRHFSVDINVQGATRWVPVTIRCPAEGAPRVWHVEFDGVSYLSTENPTSEAVANEIERYYNGKATRDVQPIREHRV